MSIQAYTTIEPRRLFGVNLAEIWEYRELFYYFAWRDLKVRYKQTILGAAWAIIQPFCAMVVFSVVFGRLLGTPSDGLPYPIFYYTALLPWTYFANTLITSTNRIVEQQRLVTKVYFPRLILPASAAMSGLVDLAFGGVILAGLFWYYSIVPGWTILAVPIFVALTVLTALSFGIWLCALNAMYRDVRYALPLLIQVWLFLSPVVYPSNLVPERWRVLYGINPMAHVITGFRWALTGQGSPPDSLALLALIPVILLFASGIVYFRWMEGRIADVL